MNQCASDLKHYYLRGYWGDLGDIEWISKFIGGVEFSRLFCINRLRTI